MMRILFAVGILLLSQGSLQHHVEGGGAHECTVPPMPEVTGEEWKFQQMNAGWKVCGADSTYLMALIAASPDIASCGDSYSIKEVLYRADNTSVTIECTDKSLKYALMDVKRMNFVEDLTDSPPVNNAPGGWKQVSEETLPKIIDWFEINKGGSHCVVNRSTCIEQSSTMKPTYVCQETCTENGVATVKYPKYTKVLQLTASKLQGISDVPVLESLRKLTLAYAKTIFETSENTMTFIKDHCHFTGDIVVVDNWYVQIRTGEQHLVEVYPANDPMKHVYLAIYQYSFPNTKPFMIAHPFMQECHGIGFLHRIMKFTV